MPDVVVDPSLEIDKLQTALDPHVSKITFQDFAEDLDGFHFYLLGRGAKVLVRVRLVEMEDNSWRPFVDLAPWIRQELKLAGIILEDEEYHPDEYQPPDKKSIWQLRDTG
jgi:hypothetical protein